MGRPEEGAALAEAVLADGLADDHLLHLCGLVLKPADRLEPLTAAYEAAAAAEPGSEELAVGVFTCHVRRARARPPPAPPQPATRLS